MSEAKASVAEDLPLPEIKVRSANRVYFHTTIEDKLPLILKHGIIAPEDHGVMGNDLMYSLFFDEEYKWDKGIRHDRGTAENFVITVWKDPSDAARSKYSFGSRGDLSPRGTLPPQVLEELEEIGKIARGIAFNQEHAKGHLRRTAPNSLLAYIPITEAAKTALVRAQLAFLYNLYHVDVLERQLVEFLKDPANGVEVRSVYTPEVLAHAILARVQQTILIKKTREMVQTILDTLHSEKPVDKLSAEDIQVALKELVAKAKVINEPISERYLATLSKQVQQAIVHRPEVSTQSPDKRYLPAYRSQRHPYYNFDYELKHDREIWGGKEGGEIAERIAKELRLTNGS